MADVVVTITRNGSLCTITPNPFRAKKNASVEFVFVGVTNSLVDFGDDSPFGDTTSEKKFPPGQKKVKAQPRTEPYKYTVVWPGGDGNGSGEIIP